MFKKSLKLKRLLGKIYSFFTSQPKVRNIILIYHSVDGGPASTPLKNFSAQMAWLAENAEVVTLDVLLGEEDTSKLSYGLRVALTFDDGYKSLIDTAAPILDKHGFPASVFINTAEIGEAQHTYSSTQRGHYPNEKFLLWSEIAELQGRGWTVGSHGVHHVDLCNCDLKEIERQLIDSKQCIENRLGTVCKYFCYTWGHYNSCVKNAVKSTGYTAAVAGIHSGVTPVSNIFALPRLDIRHEYALNDFIDVVMGHWDYLGLKQRLMRMLS